MQKSSQIDFVADSLWSAAQTAEYVARWQSTTNVRFIFLPIHYPTGHFALAMLDCRLKKCVYLDSVDGGELLVYII